MKITNLQTFINPIKQFPTISFGNKTTQTNSLERSPQQDSFITKDKVSGVKQTSTTKVSNPKETLEAQKILKQVKDEKLLGDEILVLLQPKTDAKGNKYFTPNQLKVIYAAQKRIKLFKTMSKKLEQDATAAMPQVMSDIKEVFGGEKGLGKHIIARIKNGQFTPKDSISIYNKIIKSYKSDKVENEILSIFSKKLYQKPYKFLDKDEKGLVKLSLLDGDVKADSKDLKAIEKILTPTPKSYEEASAYVRDLIGLRLVLPTGDKKEMAQVENYLTKAILSGKLNVTKVSNYHSNHILPYISQDTIKMWQQAVNGLYIVESADIRKRNGYTTTQMNIEHNVGKNKMVRCELQIRTKLLNDIGQREHLIYDILENKNISKDIPELAEYYKNIRIKEAVYDVFKNDKKEQQYTDYERAMYSWVRLNETEKDKSKIYAKPLLSEYGLGEYQDTLSFDALEKINDDTKRIKEQYYKRMENK